MILSAVVLLAAYSAPPSDPRDDAGAHIHMPGRVAGAFAGPRCLWPADLLRDALGEHLRARARVVPGVPR